jgi:hypothetical protein
MAAIDLSTVNAYPHTHRAGLSATPDTMQEVAIPAAATQVQIIFETNAGKVITQGGTDATVISTEHYLTIPANSLYFHDIAKAQGEHSIWVASGTASTNFSIQIGTRD